MAAKPIVELRDITVRFPNGVMALDGITLDVNNLDLIALIGPNGAGKSTLLKVILGLIKPTSGTVKLFGNQDLAQNLKYVGYVPQSAQARDPNLPFTVFETVMLGLTPQAGTLHRVGADATQKVEETLKLFGIVDLKDRRIGQLSGGQAQRVFLAKAMVTEPKLLLLDEPTSGVDTTSKAEFYSMLERLNKEKGITVILSSHDVGVITKIANRVLCINRAQFFCGENADFRASAELHKVYGHPVEIMDHDDHP
ncbi:MAG TPA: metal ABC transporter ATP-binding protein [Candidatus Bathyarchaeia archaeon]|nr:metal ABC transporter ATP-binding protein [Candidatus Bathyarchaeia archaeon]